MEFLYQRKHNQLNDVEREWVSENKKAIAARITHVMDCEAYLTGKKKYFFVKFWCIE
jgi:hypothetical protein